VSKTSGRSRPRQGRRAWAALHPAHVRSATGERVLRRWLVAACFGLVGWLLASQTARADIIPLADLEVHALHARPSLAAGDARVAAAKARIDLARSAYSPTLNLLGDASISPGTQLVRLATTAIDSSDPNFDSKSEYLVGASRKLGQSGAFNPFPRYGVTLDLRGNLYDFGRTSAAVDAAHAQRRAAQADAQQSAREIVRDVRTAYVRWATAHALWSIARDAAKAAADRSARTSAAIEEGARPNADRIASQTEAAFSRLELERSSATLETARLDLGFVAVADLPEDAQPDPAVLRAGASPAAVEHEQDPSLVTLQEQRKAAQASARVHDHAFAPILGAQAQAGVQGQGTYIFPVYRLGINISVPLWDGGADGAARAQAQAHAAELAAQAADYTQARDHQRVRSEALQAQAARRIELAQELVQLTQARLAQLDEGYPLGAATLQELADARAGVQRANTELVLAQAMRAEAALDVQ
jgi:outer membrane protein